MNELSAPFQVSVVIPTYNEPFRLKAALQSLSCQDYPVSATEIVVVDDASPQSPNEWLDGLACPFPIKLIRHTTNQGRARARNSGLRTSQGELILFLDSDMTVEPNFIRNHTSMHQYYTNTVVIGNIRFARHLTSNSLTRYLESRGVHRLSKGDAVPFNCFVTGNASVPRKLLMDAGLFDERFTAYGGEDLELGYRLYRKGIDFHYAPQALSWHHHLRTLDQLCQLMHTYGLYSLPLLMQKHSELAPLLQLEFLDNSRLSCRNWLLKLALAPRAYQIIQTLIKKNQHRWIPALFYDYLIWYNRTHGYLEAIRIH